MKRRLREILILTLLLSSLSAHAYYSRQTRTYTHPKETKTEENPNAKYSEESWWFENRDYIKKLVSLLEAGETVVLAVIGDEFLCSDVVIADPVQRAEFLNRYEKQFVEEQTQQIVQEGYFANHSKFAVVDRKAVSQILSELNFQQTGYVTKEMRDQLGNLLGVTHLMMVSAARTTETSKPQGYSHTDALSVKLIELRLGKILTMESTSCHYINDQATKWTKRIIYSQNRRDYNFMETDR